jgi:DNA-binding CsgD family transcriptional regulator
MDALTKRQREVLSLAAKGMTNPEIGDRLGISKDGAKWHIGEILARLNVDTREEAVDLWRRYNGLPYRLHRIVRAVLGPMAMRWVLGGVGATAVAGLAVVLVVLATQGGDESRADVTPAASVSPTVAASPAASPTAVSSPTTDAAGGYRTGNPDIDPVLAAIESGNRAKLIAVTRYMQIPCVTNPPGLGAPPTCPTGVPDGTVMEVVPGSSGGEGSYLARADYENAPIVPGVGMPPYAIFRTPGGGSPDDPTWPLGAYTIVYPAPQLDGWFNSVSVSGGKIVNRIYTQSRDTVFGHVAQSDFILPPKTP